MEKSKLSARINRISLLSILAGAAVGTAATLLIFSIVIDSLILRIMAIVLNIAAVIGFIPLLIKTREAIAKQIKG